MSRCLSSINRFSTLSNVPFKRIGLVATLQARLAKLDAELQQTLKAGETNSQARTEGSEFSVQTIAV